MGFFKEIDIKNLNTKQREIYSQCRGYCEYCLMEGGCYIEKKLKRRKK
jgi:hypothetical protein